VWGAKCLLYGCPARQDIVTHLGFPASHHLTRPESHLLVLLFLQCALKMLGTEEQQDGAPQQDLSRPKEAQNNESDDAVDAELVKFSPEEEAVRQRPSPQTRTQTECLGSTARVAYRQGRGQHTLRRT
jgi:hypothetical protein